MFQRYYGDVAGADHRAGSAHRRLGRMDNPKEVGSDRIMNTVAAVHLYGGPAVVVDFGTSTNFDAVSAQGDFVGGALAPGIEISVDALSRRAAQLLKVELARPQHVIGKNTVEALQSGIIFGFATARSRASRQRMRHGTRPRRSRLGNRHRHRRARPAGPRRGQRDRRARALADADRAAAGLRAEHHQGRVNGSGCCDTACCGAPTASASSWPGRGGASAVLAVRAGHPSAGYGPGRRGPGRLPDGRSGSSGRGGRSRTSGRARARRGVQAPAETGPGPVVDHGFNERGAKPRPLAPATTKTSAR